MRKVQCRPDAGSYGGPVLVPRQNLLPALIGEEDTDMNAEQKSEYDRRKKRSERLQKAIAKGDEMLRATSEANNARMRELADT